MSVALAVCACRTIACAVSCRPPALLRSHSAILTWHTANLQRIWLHKGMLCVHKKGFVHTL